MNTVTALKTVKKNVARIVEAEISSNRRTASARAVLGAALLPAARQTPQAAPGRLYAYG
jgi:hypothetical protein